jgi:hypothetical protein
MSKKIGIYVLTAIAKEVIRVANRNKQRIIANGGEALWTIVELLIGIAGILVSVIEANENVEGDWQSPLSSLNSGTINQVQGAVAQFYASNGIVGGG